MRVFCKLCAATEECDLINVPARIRQRVFTVGLLAQNACLKMLVMVITGRLQLLELAIVAGDFVTRQGKVSIWEA